MSKESRSQIDLGALSDLAPELADMMVSLACDIALVLDDGGVIKSVALGGVNPPPDAVNEWIGQRWTETVSGDMRQKAERFLEDIAHLGTSRTRHLSHAADAGPEIPMAYTAVRLGEQGPTLAVGRDLRRVAAMQERLTETQREIELQQWRKHYVDTHYHLLFQAAAEAMLVVDASSFTIVDANPSVQQLFADSNRDLVGKPLTDLFRATAGDALRDLLNCALASTRELTGEASRLNDGARIGISIAPFRGETATVLCLLLSVINPTREPIARALPLTTDARFIRLFEQAADGVAICNLQGNVLFVNEALLTIAELPDGETMLGKNIFNWIGNAETASAGMLNLLDTAGGVRLHRSHLRRSDNGIVAVDISATVLADFDCVGLIVRVCHEHESTEENPSSPRPNGIN